MARSPLTTFNPHRPGITPVFAAALTEARNRSHLPAQTALIQARTHSYQRLVERRSNDSVGRRSEQLVAARRLSERSTVFERCVGCWICPISAACSPTSGLEIVTASLRRRERARRTGCRFVLGATWRFRDRGCHEGTPPHLLWFR